MAAIDKMYLHSYYEFDELRKWALVYYPELIFYMNRLTMNYAEYCESRDMWVKQTKEDIRRDYARFRGKTGNQIQNLIDYYKRTVDYDCPWEQAVDEYKYCEKQMQKTDSDLEDDYTFLAMNTPMRVDRKLKWICPVPCVRKYLQNQCGVNPKREWLYKLFWKGKKHF